MSFLSFLPRRPICLNCIRRGIGEDSVQFPGLSWTQVRGKKKSVKKSDTINVRLLVNMKGYGRKGTITPVAPGRMRNSWYPRQQAEYVSTLRDINPKTMVAERDFTFGMQDIRKKEAQKSAYDPVTLGPMPTAKMNLLTPQMATELLSKLLPSRLVFHRTAIVENELERSPTELSKPKTRRAASQAAQETYAASEPAPSAQAPTLVPKLQTIFGSVSTAEVVDSVKNLLATSEEGKRIVVGPEDIKFVGEVSDGVEGDRLKALGDFQVEIRVKGADVAVRRTIGVIPPER